MNALTAEWSSRHRGDLDANLGGETTLLLESPLKVFRVDSPPSPV
jgi:hypothetical protein